MPVNGETNRLIITIMSWLWKVERVIGHKTVFFINLYFSRVEGVSDLEHVTLC